MSSTINATTTNGVQVTGDNSGSLQLQTNNGTTAITIDTSQNVGIGTTSPTQKLHVNNSSAASSLAIFTNSNTGSAGSDGSYIGVDATGNMYVWNQENLPMLFGTNNGERMRIDASGNVGIGGSPSYPLHVSKASAAGAIWVASQNTDATAGSQAGFLAIASGANNYSTLSQSVGGSTAYTNAGAGALSLATVQAQPILFYTSNSERMRIDSSGNVGIGTASPSYKLHVSSAQGSGAIQSTTTTNSTYLAFVNGGGTSYIGVDTSTGSVFSSGAYGMTMFNAANAATTFFTNATERMRIDSSGNVGIGTSSPACKVDVTGVVRSTSSGGPASGAGVEISYGGTANTGDILAYDRTGAVFKNLELRCSNLIFNTGGGGERMRIDSSGNVLIGTTTQATGALLTVNGSIKGVLTLGTSQASTSGTSIDFTGIPSWARRIVVMFSGVSTNGSSNILIQIGSGSVTTSGYVSQGSYGSNAFNSTAGFILDAGGAATSLRDGSATLTVVTGNSWINTSVLSQNGQYASLAGGRLSLGGALDRVRITTANGTDTFDAGTINILYEG